MAHSEATDRGLMAVLVTGAGSGIGKACASYLAEQGVRVIAGVRDNRQQAALALVSPEIRAVCLDVTNEGSIAAARAVICEELRGEPLRGIVHSAGIGVPAPLELVPVATLREQLEVNVIGPFAVTQALLPLMSTVGACIVFVGSTSGVTARANCGAYCAAESALRALAEVWRQELEPIRQHVCLLELDKIDTPIWAKSQRRLEQIWNRAKPEIRRRYAHLEQRTFALDQKRMTVPRQVAERVWQILTAECPPPVVRMD